MIDGLGSGCHQPCDIHAAMIEKESTLSRPPGDENRTAITIVQSRCAPPPIGI
jgi:hypothetical protein